MADNEIFVTKPSLPPLEEFTTYLEKIWSSGRVTNNGPFHNQLEERLCEYLGVDHISLFANGTLAIVTALQALRITGEVITTPYTFVATSHALLWNNITPVFVDIDPGTCNLDPAKIESAITPHTTAILPVHCYGNPCDVEAIQKVADTYGLKVIYDAAHAFGVKYKSETLLKHGDLSVLSFHATKVFNTFEGGAIVCPDKKIKTRIDYLKNFGFADEVTVTAPGINGKMSEVNAAFGLLQLDYIDEQLKNRKEIDRLYKDKLSNVKGVNFLPHPENTQLNYSYFPVFINEKYPVSRDELYKRLADEGVHGRRYFYPLVSEMPMYRSLPSADKALLPNSHYRADGVICLPLYPELERDEVERICKTIKETK